ncbi:MAG: leucine-rich repeat domain-containing protein, partial [Candidatus Thorarchaeota archaeon]
MNNPHFTKEYPGDWVLTEIVLEYEAKDSRKKESRFDKEETNFDLSRNGIKTIDLTPLLGNTVVETLNLGSNKLEKLDLKPISQCTSLMTLNIFKNQLTEV